MEHQKVLQTICPLDCPDACGLDVTLAQGRIVNIQGVADDPITNQYICGKVRQYHRHVYSPERISTPARRVGPKGKSEFVPISWDEAYSRIAKRIKEDRDSFGGESILPLCYGGSNGRLTQNAIDMRFFYRLGASYLKRNLCAAPATAAYQAMYGLMPGVSYEDFAHSKLIVLWGNNPHASGIHLVPFIRKAQKNGAKLVVIDPRQTPFARLADLHLSIYPGTDLPVALACIHQLFETQNADLDFLNQYTLGQESLRKRAAVWPIEKAAEVARIPVNQLHAFLEMFSTTNPAVIRCGWGPERNRNGGSAIAAILAIAAVANKFGVRGGGFAMSASGAWQLDSQLAIRSPSPSTRQVNMNRLGEDLLNLDNPPIRSLFVYNCNPIATLPEQNKVREGLQRSDLFTVVFDQVFTDTTAFADIVLPATSFLEHHDLRNGYGYPRMGAIAPIINPIGESRPNYQVFADLIEQLELSEPDDPVTPDELQEAVLGNTLWKNLQEQGHLLPDSGRNPLPMHETHPGTTSGKIELFPECLDKASEAGLYTYLPDLTNRKYPLALISPASSKTINSTLGQLIQEPATVRIHPDDASQRNLISNQQVRVHNDLGEVLLTLQIEPRIPKGVAEIPKGLWLRHTINGQTSNALSPDTLSDIGEGACFNDARVEICAVNNADE